MTSIWVGELTHYDKTASRDLSPLAPGQFVYTRPDDHHYGERWRPGEVLGEVAPRSYVVQTQDRLVRQNRIHSRPSEPLSEQPVTATGGDVRNSAEMIVPNPRIRVSE